jgi:hypothetical protein
VIADHDHDKIIPITQERGAHVEAGSHLEAARFELAQAKTAMNVWSAKHRGQLTQTVKQISARGGG